MKKDPIVYVDFGGTRISAIAGYVQEDNFLNIMGEQEKPSDDVKSGIVDKMTGAAYKINELLRFLQNALNLNPIQTVSTSVNARSMKHYTYTIETQIINVVSNTLLTATDNQCKEEVTSDKVHVFRCIPLAYYVDDVRVSDPLGKRGSKLRIDYNVIIGNNLVQENLERCIERTGIGVDRIHLGMDAIATVLLEEEEKENGCAIISFGANTTTLGVYSKGVLQELRVIPLGGEDITSDIQELGISRNNAELLKCKKGLALERLVENPVNIQIPNETPNLKPIKISTQFLATIIEARLEEILNPIFDQIDNIRYPLNSGIVITGGAAKLDGLIEFIQEHTGFQVRMGNHTDWLSDDTDPKFYDPKYSEAIGSILLTNDFLSKDVTLEVVAIEPKLPRDNIFKKAAKKLKGHFEDSVQSLFQYDEEEMQNNNSQKEENEQESSS